MEPKLVYRSLRKISEWTLTGFYSEIYVTGQENIPEDGPLIVTPCHHNEILDVATLSATMPHRRPVSYWAKASLFANPVMSAIMSSSGAIPVRRNPNSATFSANVGSRTSDTRLSLFRESFRALDEGSVIGLFPEGTSYTEPRIAQVKEGAAWLALEYARWQLQRTAAYDQKGGPKKLQLVPVGIVYTEKTAFQSRIVVAFGEPIDLEPYARRYLAADSEQSSGRDEVRSLTGHIENRLLKLTINAPNWDHLFAAKIARDIMLEGDEEIPLERFIGVSQFFINRLGGRSDSPGSSFKEPESPKEDAIRILTRYYALLHHTGMSHRDLSVLYHKPTEPTPSSSIAVFIQQLLTLLLHPRFIVFLPVLPLHLPVYAAGYLAKRYLVHPGEPEAEAEHKAVCGGLVFGVVAFTVGRALAGTCKSLMLQGFEALVEQLFASGGWASSVGSVLLGLFQRNSLAAATMGAMGTAASMYATTWVLFRWHSALVRGNYIQFNRTLAAWKVMLGVHSTNVLPAEALASVSRPPLPKPNPYIKRRAPRSDDDASSTQTPSGPTTPANGARRRRTPAVSSLIRPLLAARAEAEASVRSLFA